MTEYVWRPRMFQLQGANKMREKILVALRNAGHGLTPNTLMDALGCSTLPLDLWLQMEQERLLILHRADGSAGTYKGQIVLICLRPEGF